MNLQEPAFVPAARALAQPDTSIGPCKLCKNLALALIFEAFGDCGTWKLVVPDPPAQFFYRYRRHYDKLSLLQQSAQICSMCNLMIDRWAFTDGERDQNRDPEYWVLVEPGDLDKSFIVTTDFCRPAAAGQRFELFHRRPQGISDVLVRDEDAVMNSSAFVRLRERRKYRRIRREPQVYSGSEECFALAGKWITECSNMHTACTPTEHNFMPTRLIDTCAGASKQIIRLCESLVVSKPYVALSHCWGGEVALRTTESNRTAHLHEIKPTNIPNTFRDAITIVRKLGFQYLWIDALCIVQDSTANWKKEAAVMDRVYAGAAVTISAADSPNSLSGIFSKRKQQRSVPLCLQDSESMILHDVHVSALEQTGDVYEDLAISVLNGRAWTLQERVLSRANLHFTDKALIWECRTHTRTEDGHTSNSQSLFKHIENSLMYRGDDYHGPTTILQWYPVVQEYSRRQMTFDSDKLEALRGLANHFTKIAGASDYAYGLWLTDIPRGLLWRRRIDVENLESIPNSVPSWSWASRKGPIQYHYSIPWIVGTRPVPSYLNLRIRELPLAGVSKRLRVEGYLQETLCVPIGRSRNSRSETTPGTTGFNCALDLTLDVSSFEGRCWCLYVYAKIDPHDARVCCLFLVLEELFVEHERVFRRIGTGFLVLEKHECTPSFGPEQYPGYLLDKKVMALTKEPEHILLTLI